MSMPDYEGWHDELTGGGHDDTALDAVLSQKAIQAWADTPVGLLLDRFERLTNETARYVIWPRGSAEWTESFFSFFCDGTEATDLHGGTKPLAAFTSRAHRLTYGVCNTCDYPLQRPEELARNRARVQAAYEAHLENVRAYFDEEPSRARRILYLDQTADDAGRRLCEFYHSQQATRCASLSEIPDVDVWELQLQMNAEAARPFLRAYHEARPPPRHDVAMGMAVHSSYDVHVDAPFLWAGTYHLPPAGWTPIGRSVLTTDVTRAIAQLSKRFRGAEVTKVTGLAVDGGAGCAKAADLVFSGTGQVMTLVQAVGGPQLGVSLAESAAAGLREFSATVQQNIDPSEPVTTFASIIDNHDGLSDTTVDIRSASNSQGGMFDDLGGALCYSTTSEMKPMPTMLRGYIPGSITTWEVPGFAIDPDELQRACGPQGPTQLVSTCRISPFDQADMVAGFYSRKWFKFTTTTNDPKATRAFVVDLLGAAAIHSSYPEPGDPPSIREFLASKGYSLDECQHSAAWAAVNVGSPGKPSYFMLHFIESEDPAMLMHGVNERVSSARNLSEGVFDEWLHNSLVISVPSLAPYREKLDARNVPYLLRTLDGAAPQTTGTTVGALFVGLPSSAFALQLRSTSGFDPQATPRLSVCGVHPSRDATTDR